MPIFDPLLRSLVARVVYDGPGLAGKTTNVTQICRAFPIRKRSEVYTPGALKGRTMFFDWLELEVGALGALPVRVQILSVPGQKTRSYRRRPLILSADAVVFVCDSRIDQLDETRQRLALLRRYLRERREPVPYIVQANKQDQPGALPPDELARALSLRDGIPIFGALASSGRGVRETFNAAARAAARYAQRVIAQRGLASIAGTPQSADSLLDALLALEDQMDDAFAEDDPSEQELRDVGWEAEDYRM